MVDSHYTRWECVRAYLCRIIDMLNMGLVEEMLSGGRSCQIYPG